MLKKILYYSKVKSFIFIFTFLTINPVSAMNKPALKKKITSRNIQDVLGKKATRINVDGTKDNQSGNEHAKSFFNWINTQAPTPQQIDRNQAKKAKIKHDPFAALKNEENYREGQPLKVELNLADGSSDMYEITFYPVILSEDDDFAKIKPLENYLKEDIKLRTIPDLDSEFEVGFIYMLDKPETKDRQGYLINFYRFNDTLTYVVDAQQHRLQAASVFINQARSKFKYHNHLYVGYAPKRIEASKPAIEESSAPVSVIELTKISNIGLDVTKPRELSPIDEPSIQFNECTATSPLELTKANEVNQSPGFSLEHPLAPVQISECEKNSESSCSEIISDEKPEQIAPLEVVSSPAIDSQVLPLPRSDLSPPLIAAGEELQIEFSSEEVYNVDPLICKNSPQSPAAPDTVSKICTILEPEILPQSSLISTEVPIEPPTDSFSQNKNEHYRQYLQIDEYDFHNAPSLDLANVFDEEIFGGNGDEIDLETPIVIYTEALTESGPSWASTGRKLIDQLALNPGLDADGEAFFRLIFEDDINLNGKSEILSALIKLDCPWLSDVVGKLKKADFNHKIFNEKIEFQSEDLAIDSLGYMAAVTPQVSLNKIAYLAIKIALNKNASWTQEIIANFLYKNNTALNKGLELISAVLEKHSPKDDAHQWIKNILEVMVVSAHENVRLAASKIFFLAIKNGLVWAKSHIRSMYYGSEQEFALKVLQLCAASDDSWAAEILREAPENTFPNLAGFEVPEPVNSVPTRTSLKLKVQKASSQNEGPPHATRHKKSAPVFKGNEKKPAPVPGKTLQGEGRKGNQRKALEKNKRPAPVSLQPKESRIEQPAQKQNSQGHAQKAYAQLAARNAAIDKELRKYLKEVQGMIQESEVMLSKSQDKLANIFNSYNEVKREKSKLLSADQQLIETLSQEEYKLVLEYNETQKEIGKIEQQIAQEKKLVQQIQAKSKKPVQPTQKQKSLEHTQKIEPQLTNKIAAIDAKIEEFLKEMRALIAEYEEMLLEHQNKLANTLNRYNKLRGEKDKLLPANQQLIETLSQEEFRLSSEYNEIQKEIDKIQQEIPRVKQILQQHEAKIRG